MALRVVFMGTPEFAVPTLDAIRRQRTQSRCGVCPVRPGPPVADRVAHPGQLLHTGRIVLAVF